MKKIAIGNEKGGIGKTTMAYHLAARAAELGERSTMIDADPQGSLSMLLGLPNNPGLYNILVRGEDFAKHRYSVPTDRYTRHTNAIGRLAIIPGNTETRLISQSDQYSRLILADLLEEMEEAGETTVIMDTGPSPSEWHNAVYMAADAVVIPVLCEPLGVAGLYNTLAHIQKANKMRSKDNLPPLHILGIVPNMYRAKTALHQTQLEDIEEKVKPFGIPILKPVDQRIVWGEASDVGQTLFAYAPDSTSALQISEITTMFLAQEEPYVRQ